MCSLRNLFADLLFTMQNKSTVFTNLFKDLALLDRLKVVPALVLPIKTAEDVLEADDDECSLFGFCMSAKVNS